MNSKLNTLRLNQLKQSLFDDLERGEEASEVVQLEQNTVGRLSRMDALQQQAMQKASRELIRKRLVQIEHALFAIEEGDYGYCSECGESIDEKRLDIKPEALVCVVCQGKLEGEL